MSNTRHTREFVRLIEADIGARDNVLVHGNTYSTSLTQAHAQVCINTGAANVTCYPTPEALEALAIDLCDLAESVRLLRQQVAA